MTEFVDKFLIDGKDLLIDGKWVRPVKGGTFDTINPANDEVIRKVGAATAEDVDLAVKAATKCLNSETWGFKSTGAQRAVILRKLGELLEANKDNLARLDSLDEGKPLREAIADINDAVTACNHFADLAEQRDGHQGEIIENGTGEGAGGLGMEPKASQNLHEYVLHAGVTLKQRD